VPALLYTTKIKEDARKLDATFKEQFPSTQVVCYAADLTTAAAVENLFADVLADLGRVDVVIKTTGMSELTEIEYDKMFA
jgi:NAD(P)-dependent dehydrogenase (short-subunit alcohol dehydrogenase family)